MALPMIDTLSPAARSELTTVLGREPIACTVESLTHNARNAVTAGIRRISGEGWSVVLKELQHVESDDPQWAASTEPAHWNYWRREALAYENGIDSAWRSSGIRAPRLLHRFERDDTSLALWLEDVSGPGAEHWGVEGLAEFAHRLGAAQAAHAELAPQHGWLSRNFLRSYSASKAVDYSLLDADAAWDHPLVRDNCPAETRSAATLLYTQRERLLSIMDSLPRTLCHLDVWPRNLVADSAGDRVLLDWAFVGDGAVGEDIGNLVPDCTFDLLYPSAILTELEQRVFDAYVSGLRSAGWQGDRQLVRLGMCASAVKYAWLTPLMLARAADEEHLDYGGAARVSGPQRYAERGATIVHLGRWAAEALSF